MAPLSRRVPGFAEVAYAQLRNCLVNLPHAIAGTLNNADAAAQDIIVELQCRGLARSANGPPTENKLTPIYLGWTGLPSNRPSSSSGVKSSSRGSGSNDGDLVVEIDATFARTLGIAEGQKVGIVIHVDPPLAHTVNIEPQTSSDWEIIELHDTFLEINMLSQIRALPNPAFTPPKAAQVQQPHPLTLHLSPTSTANVVITSFVPALPTTAAFAKLAPDAEVVIAPKTRPRLSRVQKESQSVTSGGRLSASGRSATSGGRSRSHRQEAQVPKATFLRAIDKTHCTELFENTESHADKGLKIWLDPEVISSKLLQGSDYACVSIVRPATLEAPPDPHQQPKTKDQESSYHATRIIARILVWEDSPNPEHAALSSSLCTSLGAIGLAGGVIRIDQAPPQVSSSVARDLKFYPFALAATRQSEGLKFGGETTASRELLAKRFKVDLRDESTEIGQIWSGPLTDGLIFPTIKDMSGSLSSPGGVLKFSSSNASGELEKQVTSWTLSTEASPKLEVMHEIPHPYDGPRQASIEPEPLPSYTTPLVAVDDISSRLFASLKHQSSVLLNGGQGSGKTSMAQSLARRLRQEELYHTTFFPCQKLKTDETRVTTIKETLTRLFMAASWGCRYGGHAIVILDNLDKLCPVETELQVGGDNGRSRHISELLCSISRQYCYPGSGVVLLITAQSKESLNSVVIGSHIVRTIMDLKAPNKEARRQLLSSLTESFAEHRKAESDSETGSSQDDDSGSDGPSHQPRKPVVQTTACILSKDVDFLDIAGRTDGYMPGDLGLLLSRVKSEALIRNIRTSSSTSSQQNVVIANEDFDAALQGFTPASLKNVTLQTSSTTFASIGGLHATRKILLETLQYPTTYAPIFAQCPLRLRSGLLLYGYPGCGKTLLASAVAGECGLNFISVKGPEILNKYIGASEKSVRDLFDRAEAARPCVLFFDEFDSIAPKRGHDSTGVTDRVVNQLLTQMDGAEGLSGVYVLAATSRPDLIDPALLRPGRLDKSLLCDMPDRKDRLDILQALSKKLKFDPGLLNGQAERGLDEVAGRTEGYSGADLQAVVYNAHLEAIHDALGDRNGTSAATSKSRFDASNSMKPRHKSREIMQFLVDQASDDDPAHASTSSKLQSQAALVAQLENIKLANRKEREARRLYYGGGNDGDVRSSHRDQVKEEVEVVVQWQHLERSLASTRPSISAPERRKLERVYREFVVGRSGEMGNGEGSGEWGGRSSLM